MKTDIEALEKAVNKLIERELEPSYYRGTDEHKLLVLRIIREVVEKAREVSNEE